MADAADTEGVLTEAELDGGLAPGQVAEALNRALLRVLRTLHDVRHSPGLFDEHGVRAELVAGGTIALLVAEAAKWLAPEPHDPRP
jgi:hypothetical protein